MYNLAFTWTAMIFSIIAMVGCLVFLQSKRSLMIFCALLAATTVGVHLGTMWYAAPRGDLNRPLKMGQEASFVVLPEGGTEGIFISVGKDSSGSPILVVKKYIKHHVE